VSEEIFLQYFITPMMSFRGVTHEVRRRPHPVLLRVDLDIISMSFCNGSSSYNGRIPRNFLCAGSMDGSRDACFGGNLT
jgi:hypothetical protein